MVKSGLEFFILKSYVSLQRYLLTCQANSAIMGRFFCTEQQQLLWARKDLFIKNRSKYSSYLLLYLLRFFMNKSLHRTCVFKALHLFRRLEYLDFTHLSLFPCFDVQNNFVINFVVKTGEKP